MAAQFDSPFTRRRFIATCAAVGLAGNAAPSLVAQEGRAAPVRKHEFPGDPPRAALPFRRPPGVVIGYAPVKSGQCICSPSLVILDDGEYIASHGLTGPLSSRDRTQVYLSDDRGRSWKLLAEIQGQTWTSLFTFAGRLHLFGVDREHGSLVLRIPSAGVLDWNALERRPPDVLRNRLHYVTSPTPVVVHNDRVWKAFEDVEGDGRPGKSRRAFVLSAPAVLRDLDEADSWSASNRCDGDPAWLDGTFRNWGDGNIVVTPDGKLFNVLSVDRKGADEKAALIAVSPDGMFATFKPETGFIDFPGGAKKFTIRYDKPSQRYWSLTNWAPPQFRSETPGNVCNTLALASSPDLREWRVNAVIRHHPDVVRHSFSHADWQIDGDDLVAVTQSAWGEDGAEAPNVHDANFLTFQRVSNFRTLKLKDSVVDPLTLGVAAAHVEQGWTTPNP